MGDTGSASSLRSGRGGLPLRDVHDEIVAVLKTVYLQDARERREAIHLRALNALVSGTLPSHIEIIDAVAVEPRPEISKPREVGNRECLELLRVDLLSKLEIRT